MITLLLSLLFSPISGAEDRFHYDVLPGEARELLGKSFVVFTHPTAGYDLDRRAESATKAVNAWAKAAKIPQIMLFSGALDNTSYYLGSRDVDLTVASGAGGHSLTYPEANSFLLAGGNFGLCFCETLRDNIRGTDAPEVHISLVTDALYDNQFSIQLSSGPPILSLLKRLPTRTNTSLEDMRSLMSAPEFLEFIKSRIFRDGALCPHQGVKLHLENHTIELELPSHKIKLGNGPKKVSIHFLRSTDLAPNSGE